jgi:predicted nucleotidyltransferase
MEQGAALNKYVFRIMDIVSKHIRQSGYSVSLYLFGSWARGEQKRTSDVDIALLFDGGSVQDHKNFVSQTRSILEESTVPYHVDVVYMNGAPQTLAERIKEEGILWQGSMNESR